MINTFCQKFSQWSGGGLWLSVDPLADNYPFLSPYVYGACSPVVLVDADGRLFDDIFRNSKTGEVTIIKTNDPYDREFVDGRLTGYHEQGWGISTYENARVFDLNLPDWQQSYLFFNGDIVGLAAWRSGLIWGPEDDVEAPAMTLYIGIIDFSDCGRDCYGFYQTFTSDYHPLEPDYVSYKVDGNSRGIMSDERMAPWSIPNETGIKFDLFMCDHPNRKDYPSRDFYWHANTSVMYQRGEKKHDLLTLYWVFEMKNGVVSRYKAQIISQPTDFHKLHMPREGSLNPLD